MQYKSEVRLLGLPLVHVSTGRSVDGHFQRGVARGWLAFGDIAFGALVAVGGVALGGIALGGVGVGLICLSGLGISVYALGGGALGLYSIGGLAVAWHAAMGGAAIAGKYAVGGYAVAEHANDPVAQQYMKTSVMRFGGALVQHARWFIVLALLPPLVNLYKRLKGSKSFRGQRD